MPAVNVNGIDIYYDVAGPDDAEQTYVFISGLGSQMLTWEPEFWAPLVDAGHRVVRLDNRDVGLSAKFEGTGTIEDLLAGLGGGEVEAPYRLRDMAADVIGVLDEVGVDRAHVVGASMGGMIAQTFAIEFPERAASLTSIMSTTGEPDVGTPDPEVVGVLITPSPTERQPAIEHAVGVHRAIASPTLFDEERARRKATEAYDRCFNPAGTMNQLLAILASGPRTEGLAGLDLPALVIHGEQDPLVTISGGRRTAELIPDAELLVFDEMGHDIPEPLWGEVTAALAAHASRE